MFSQSCGVYWYNYFCVGVSYFYYYYIFRCIICISFYISFFQLKRATVQNYKTGELETAHYRISKSAWLAESEHEVVERISRRVEDMTGLTTETAEELQVVNYGIGGHYEPHFDFARVSAIVARLLNLLLSLL